MAGLLGACRSSIDSDAELVWVDLAFLQGQGVMPWTDMPAWVPSGGETSGMSQVSRARSLAAGMTWRPLEQTVRDTLAWYEDAEAERPLRTGIRAEREAKVLAAWDQRRGAAGSR